MYRIAILVAVFARVCLGATPGKLVEPGVVEVTLKDGEPYNITCPPIFKKNVGDFFKPDDYEGMVAACIDGRCTLMLLLLVVVVTNAHNLQQMTCIVSPQTSIYLPVTLVLSLSCS